MMFMCRVFSCIVGKGVYYDQCVLLAKLCNLLPVSFCIPRQNLLVTPGISWLPTFAFQSPIMKRASFIVLVLEGLVGLHRTVQLQLLQHYWSGHRLGLLWYWMVCFGNKQRSFCHFWDCIQVLHFGLFCWLWGYSISSKGSLPTVVDISHLNKICPFLSILVHWFLKMLIFTLTIYC